MDVQEQTSHLKDGSGTRSRRRKAGFLTETSRIVEVFDSSDPDWGTRIRVVIFVACACLSSVTVAAKVSFTPLVSQALLTHFQGREFPPAQMDWVARLYSIVVLCLLPVTTALIDHSMVGYRFILLVAGSLHLVGSLTSATVTHPLFFVLTDSFISGFGSALTFSVVLLSIDDLFPEGNRFRTMATTLCQGSVLGSLFLLDGLSSLAQAWGWLPLHISLAAFLGAQTLLLLAVCPEYDFRIRVKRRGGPKMVPISGDPRKGGTMSGDPRKGGTVPSNKLLGLTFSEMNYSPSLFTFLGYRFSLDVIRQGVLLLVLQDSRLISSPDLIAPLSSPSPGPTLAALSYASGDTVLFLAGAFLGHLLLGYLIHVSIISLCLLFLFTIIWQPVRLQVLLSPGVLSPSQSTTMVPPGPSSQSMMVGHVICAGLTGACLGILSTCAVSLTEEATLVRGRKLYPFVKLVEALALTFTPFLFQILDRVSDQNIWLLTFAVMAAGNACLLVFILHKLYSRFLADSRDKGSSIQASMKPSQFFSQVSDSN